jgi:hypothetical protein
MGQIIVGIIIGMLITAAINVVVVSCLIANSRSNHYTDLDG